jgi:hypothetical protein
MQYDEKMSYGLKMVAEKYTASVVVNEMSIFLTDEISYITHTAESTLSNMNMYKNSIHIWPTQLIV